MFGIVNYEVFLVAAILLILTPGTDTMYIISRSISQGRMAGIYSALGISAGVVVHTLLAAFGLSVILMQSALLFNVVKIAGAIYLAYLGIKLIVSKNEKENAQEMPIHSNKKVFLQGMLTNVMNPKVALFFLAFLPQFINTNSGILSPTPFIILGVTYTLVGGIWCTITAYFSSMATNKLRSSTKASMILNKVTGFVFIAMGIKILQTKPSA
ncbi:LysE family translocator [Ureibacillus chungkukjangi]|uniref:LysE family translocator n=1 Tax=Ureibacillus chungkukjangi TaxID=1202712 RepID=UPI0020422316|nr:LysE family translocator [Ureibacillus chungkukjangi]MCM3388678.1 LysE family translocator [Ureibacillus chungkukjangi]